jgi:hypothetical protein
MDMHHTRREYYSMHCYGVLYPTPFWRSVHWPELSGVALCWGRPYFLYLIYGVGSDISPGKKNFL